MEASKRIERALEAALAHTNADGAPPLLAAAMHHAVFPGGARVRPLLCLAVARACGEDHPALTDAAACGIELMHCASLVHDDLPCFDNAETRRGREAVHRAYGQPLAVLAGDGLIVLAFERLAQAGAVVPTRIAPLMRMLSQAVGMPSGIVAGQAWESEPRICLQDYQRAKTGALFVAATSLGALAAGCDPTPWRALGDGLGEAYQVADDIRDLAVEAEELGKPAGQDVANGRPNAVLEIGLDGAMARLRSLIAEAIESIPDCDGADVLRDLVLLQAKRLVPKNLAQSAA